VHNNANNIGTCFVQVINAEAFCGLEYAENAFPAWVSPRTPLDQQFTIDAPPDVQTPIGWIGVTHRPSTQRLWRLNPRASGALVCPPPTHNLWLRHWPLVP